MQLKKHRARLIKAFEQRFGSGGKLRAAVAPGRSNLIGEHTDYNGGFVLPIAVDRHTVVVFRPQAGNTINVYSEHMDAADEFPTSGMEKTKEHWTNYVRGTAWALTQRGVKLTGGQLYIVSDVPTGAGLSSSAALEISVGLALLSLAGAEMPRQELALAGQAAEHNYAGIRCGIMDQTISACAIPGHALQLDCESLQITQVPLKLKGYSFAVFDTGVRHKLASSEYNKRRAECEHGAQLLGHKSLREVGLPELLQHAEKLNSVEARRVRHVVTENMRVAQFAAALAHGDVPELGRLLTLSHDSLARDYEVSCKELDAVVSELARLNTKDGACPGARMTGGGFGGSVVALLKTSAFPKYARALRRLAKGGSLLLEPSGGAVVVDLA